MFYWVSPSSIGFLTSGTDFYRVLIDGKKVSLGFIEVYRVVLCFTELNQIQLGFERVPLGF